MSSSRSQRQRVPGLDSMTPLPASERCEVLRVDARLRTCSVATSSGSVITGLPWPGDAYDVRAPRPGQSFIITHTHQSRGRLSDLPPEISVSAESRPVSHIEGSGTSASALSSGASKSYALSGPQDVMPGDRMWRDEAGSHMGMLAGGVLSLRASEFASVTVSRPTATVRVVANNYVVHAGAGSMAMTADDEGRTGFSLDLGSNSKYESDPSAEKFRYSKRILSDGYVDRTVVTTPSGDTVYVNEIDLDGSSFTEANYARFDARSDVDATAVDVGLDFRSMRLGIKDSASLSVGGRYAVTALGGVDLVVPASDLRAQVGGRVSLSASSGVQIKARGGTVPSPSNKAFELVAVDGSVSLRIGSPADGDRIAARSGFSLSTFAGDISLSTKTGKFSVDTLIPSSIKLGGAPGTGLFGIVLYEALETWFNLFGALLDTHTHNAAGVPTSPPLIPVWSTARPLFRTLRSRYVSTGG